MASTKFSLFLELWFCVCKKIRRGSFQKAWWLTLFDGDYNPVTIDESSIILYYNLLTISAKMDNLIASNKSNNLKKKHFEQKSAMNCKLRLKKVVSRLNAWLWNSKTNLYFLSVNVIFVFFLFVINNWFVLMENIF